MGNFAFDGEQTTNDYNPIRRMPQQREYVDIEVSVQIFECNWTIPSHREKERESEAIDVFQCCSISNILAIDGLDATTN